MHILSIPHRQNKRHIQQQNIQQTRRIPNNTRIQKRMLQKNNNNTRTNKPTQRNRMETDDKMNQVVKLYGKLSPLEEHFRQFDMGKASWTTAEYQDYATSKIPPSFLQHALKEDFKQRYKEKNNAVIYIYGNQGAGKSLCGIVLGIELGKIFGRPLTPKNITYFDSQFCENLKQTEHKDTLIHDEADQKTYGALSTYYSGEIEDAMFRNRATQQNYIFCSPHEGERGQFITIDVKNTRKLDGVPVQIEALLYTSWYYDSEIRVCRGILLLDITQEHLDFYTEYIKYKMDSLDKIKKDLGGAFDIVTRVANEKYDLLKDKLIIKPKTEKEQYELVKGAYFGDIIEIEGDISKYTRDLRQKIIRAIKVKAILEIQILNKKEEE